MRSVQYNKNVPHSQNSNNANTFTSKNSVCYFYFKLATLIVLSVFACACSKEAPSYDPKPAVDAAQPATTQTATDQSPSQTTSSSLTTLCPANGKKVGNGPRKMALIVGVGDYASGRIPDLAGPPNDAKRIYDLLTNANTFGFPKENVCLLLDDKATVAGVTQQFENFLIKDANKDDVVVFFYAGHGSQVQDTNNDESDGMDETFVLHDSRTGSGDNAIHDLTDDAFNGLLAQLHKKTQNITVILDSCNSGSATRSNSALVSRFFEAETITTIGDRENQTQAEVWSPEEFAGVVTLTAAVDGTAALEKNSKGIFTDALIQVLEQWRGAPPSYRQLVYQATPIIKADSYQVIQSNGDLDRTIFGAKKALFPHTWSITGADSSIHLGGAPMPGLGVGAQMRIYDGGAQSAKDLQPQKSKALIVLNTFDGLNASASVVSTPAGAEAIKPGDIALLTRPALAPMSVVLRSSSSRGGVPSAIAQTLRDAQKKDADLAQLLQFSKTGEFELSTADNGELQLKGPENRIRSRYKKVDDMLDNLILHAKQRAIFNLKGEAGSDLIDNQTLQVSLIPAAKQDRCAKQGLWQQAKPNSTQILPLCYRWNIQVKLSDKAPTPLNIGGVILSSDGSIFGFPADGRTERLRPGDTLTFTSGSETFRATPPIEVEDTVMVFGTNTDNSVAWHQLTRAARGASNSLQTALNSYINSPNRGVSVVNTEDNTRSWTRSVVTARVAVNTRFDAPTASASGINFREYTIPNFDIRPYLPDDKNSALYKVLQQADQLAKAANTDGIPYKQHAWAKGSDAANLALGIDCSRAIWYAFTRAGLSYNKRDNAYLATADMVTSKTAMQDEFERCPTNQAFQLGDVLVYRDEQRGDGHVVMVIDADKRIAWGSHGWDGNSKILPVEPDTGVEYQVIKIKKDWQRWDRSNMLLRQCWRHKTFTNVGETGHEALQSSCNSSSCSL